MAFNSTNGAKDSQARHLSPAHLAELAASGISPELAATAGLYSGTAADVVRVLGPGPRNRPAGPGLIFPFRDATDPTYGLVKLDHPRQKADGTPIKYEAPPKKPARPYFPPGFFERIKDTSTPIHITEGFKKGLAGTEVGLACIGLPGVWNFAAARSRRETGKGTGPRLLLDGLNSIHWNGRRVFIVFDSDRATKPAVLKAEQQLAAILAGRGADVAVLELPAGPGGEKVGLDDFLVAHGRAGLEKLIAEAKPSKREKLPSDTAPMELADRYISERLLTGDYPRLRWWRDAPWWYEGTHYRQLSASDLTRQLLVYLDGIMDGATPRKARDVVECLAARLLLGADREAPFWIGPGGPANRHDWMALENGIFDLPAWLDGSANPLRSHSVCYFTLNAVPHEYDVAATCSAWFEFLADVYDDDRERINLLQEFFGYLLTADTRMQSILMLVGPRRSGKGTILRVLRRLVGEGNCASPRLTTLGGTFGLWGLVGKTVAILPDAHLGRGSEAMATLEVLKSISGEDELEIHRKNLPPINVRLGVRFVVAVNDLPKFSDNAGAIGSRLLILPHDRSFEGREDRELEAKLAAEASGVFRWALEGLRRLREVGRFTDPAKSRQIRSDFERLSSPVAAFLADCCVVKKGDPECEVQRDELYKRWVGWCRDSQHLPGSRETFGAQLRTQVSHIQSVVHRNYRNGGNRDRFYVGVRLRLEDERPEDDADFIGATGDTDGDTGGVDHAA